ncbi:LysR family transcriptional regulator [Mycobacterium sp. CVI_P3]|uniref:LysR family transcriptional regulator n=1 Tax=Mycobacterium pinniadriaticum TaxID=2994102 RepID=A0ABT3SHD5_9MYCO|nr:LysR family transcriptional regulator [Mycobacterium pinniadriaticum]MCX2932460.1 LysR family transcriptional regulator [Mycobacterium pinniadriaticum]MCX2938906.1 LysR family transcriptional regulator [Mycobacterium pinniadriaticum]
MDTHRLKYFLRIAEEGSITRAAGVLGIAQPALSRQLQLLEDDLGIALFRRTRRGVELTEAGERLRASTAGPLRQLELAVQYAGSPVARLNRNMLLGLLETSVDVLAAPLLASLTAVFPNATFSVATGSTEQLVEAMLKGVVDAALINPVPDERVFYRELLAEDLVLVGGPESNLDPDRPVRFVDAIATPLVIPRSSAGIGTLLQNAALRAKVTVSHRITTDSVAAMKSLIEAGVVFGILPLSACRRDVDSGRMRFAPLREPVLTQRIGVAATSQLELPREVMVKVGTTIRDEVATLVKSGRWPAELTPAGAWNPALSD